MFEAVFVSDIHISTDVPERTRVFTAFLQSVRTKRIYILGDMFDFWVGCDHLHHFEHNGLVEALKRTAFSGTEIYLMPGNRDFLLNKRSAARLSAKLLPEQHLLSLPSKKILLLHGDQLLLNDVEYMVFRTLSRSYLVHKLFSALPFSCRISIAHTTRQQSRSAVKRKKRHQPRTLRFSRIALRNLLKRGVTTVVCGHLHKTTLIRFSYGDSSLSVYVLGQWTQEGGDYLVLNNGELSFRRFKTDFFLNQREQIG